MKQQSRNSERDSETNHVVRPLG